MCGIVGIVGSDFKKITTLNNEIIHRGPDAQNTMQLDDDCLALGHTRLSIIDIDERSNQPFISKCGNYYLVFNGEIYNYKDLGEKLKSKGYSFATTSDTEVLMYWIIEYGAERIDDLDGMFAFAFYNKLNRHLMLCRDHIGEKPLYYSLKNSEFAFCSEIGPLLQLSWIDKRLNAEALKDYLFFLYTPAPNTLYNGIKEVEPGQILMLNLVDMSIDARYFFELTNAIVKYPKQHSEKEDIAIFDKLFTDAVQSRLIADVQVGMFLSGGLDSNAIVAKARHLKDVRFHSFTMGYGGEAEAKEYDESLIAKKCADFYGIENTAINLSKNNDFEKNLERTIKIFTQPFGNATCLVSDSLSAEVVKYRKVCLVGDGGDELLIGYPRYKALIVYKYFSYLPSLIKRLLTNLVRFLPESGSGATKIRRIRQFLEFSDLPMAEAYLNWVGYCPMEKITKAMKRPGNTKFHDYLKSLFNRYSDDPVRAASIVDFKSFVPYNLMQSADRTSMMHALELRSPFVAKDIVIGLLNINTHNKVSKKYNKPILVKALKNILPEIIIKQQKKPFNPPMRTFIRDNIAYIRDLICSDSSFLPKILDKLFIENEISDFEKGKRDNSTYLWGLSVLEKWLRQTYSNGLDMA